ncbi:MAG: hypothetical protein Q4D62_09575 [Planctomycetia bacterium]|nr:hypothetical protein [Planctomycetia bacterium]
MASENRAEALKRLYAALQEKYTPTSPTSRKVLEQFIFATCLEDASFEAAESAFAALQHTMSGWNEVRVSSVTELAELMSQLPDPRGCAVRIKRILNGVFEERYAFDLEDLRKKNVKETFEKLSSYPGATPFSVNYVTQTTLGRHGIPLGSGEKRLLYVLGILTEAEQEMAEISGLNRAISKQDGLKFASMLHQLAAAFVVNPESRKIISFLKHFSSDFRKRMPRRRSLHVENTLETPEPVAPRETKPVRMIDILANDPDFAQPKEEPEPYAIPEEPEREEVAVEEVSRPKSTKSGKSGSSQAGKGNRGKEDRKSEKAVKTEKTSPKKETPAKGEKKNAPVKKGEKKETRSESSAPASKKAASAPAKKKAAKPKGAAKTPPPSKRKKS